MEFNLLIKLNLDNTINNDDDDDDDDKAAASSSSEAETAAEAEELSDHVHQAAGHALLLRARTGTMRGPAIRN